MSSREILVRVADLAVGGEGDVLVTLGLGSCVAAVLYDPVARVGGMAHVLLPEPSLARDTSNPAKFASTAIPLLVERMRARGAVPARIDARLAGGASMFAALMSSNAMNMGERNVKAVRAALEAARVPVCGADVGGETGRSVRFHVGEGRTVITSVAQQPVIL
jgi:chemotaxis protein CheD